MAKNSSLSDKTKILVIELIIGVMLIAPIIIYVYKFGFGLWSSNDDWARMGSFFGGIYTPILTLMMVLVLIRQTNIINNNSNYDYIRNSQTRALEHLSAVTEAIGEPLRFSLIPRPDLRLDVLNDNIKTVSDALTLLLFEAEKDISSQGVISPDTRMIARVIHGSSNFIPDWIMSMAQLDGLSATKEFPFGSEAEYLKAKVMSQLNRKSMFPDVLELTTITYCISPP